jgi:hypothetical protein
MTKVCAGCDRDFASRSRRRGSTPPCRNRRVRLGYQRASKAWLPVTGTRGTPFLRTAAAGQLTAW